MAIVRMILWTSKNGIRRWKLGEVGERYFLVEIMVVVCTSRVKNRERSNEAVRIRYCTTNIWDESELKLAWSRENTSYFENNFSIILLSGNIPCHPEFGQVMCEYDLYPIYFLLLLTNFIYMKSFFITIIKWCFCWYCWYEGSFEFSPKVEFPLPLYVHNTQEQTMKQNHCTSHNYYSVKIMLKLLAFKWFLNQL